MPWQIQAVPSAVISGQAQIYVQNSPPTGTIPVNSIWYNTTPGSQSLNTWNGTAWVQIAVPASNLISAGTIIANLMAAGIVVAGIIDGTTIRANLFIGTNTQGEALFYSGSPAIGNLVAAIAGASGNDNAVTGGAGNNYPQGFYGQQLTLQNLASTPPGFSGASVLFSSTLGRLRFVSSSGDNSVIDRSTVNTAQFSIGSVSTPSTCSAPLAYLAGEAGVSSEFELEADGIIVCAPSGTAQILNFGLAVDGSVLGGSFSIGAVFLPVAATCAFTLRARLDVLTTGSGGTCLITTDGSVNRQGVNAGSQTTPLSNITVGASSGGLTKAFDTTVNHTLQIFANWAAVTAGQNVTTYRTRLTRRN